MDHNSSAGMYVTASVEAECRMIAQNRNIQEGGNKGTSKVNALKKSAHIIKGGSSFAKLLEATSKIPRDKKTSEDPSNPLLKYLICLSTNT